MPDGKTVAIVVLAIALIITSIGFVNYYIQYTLLSANQAASSGKKCPNYHGSGAPLYCVPIVLSNSQSSATASDLQILLEIDWSSYMNRLALNVENVEFTDGQGNPLYAWCESSCAGSQISSNVWVKDDSPIAAFGYQMIYLWIFSISTNELNPQGYWGAYPTFSSYYGQYDNGPLVFTFYNNFNGSQLCSCMTTFGTPSISVDDGLTISTSSCFGCGVQTTVNFSPGTTFDSLTYATIGSYYMNIGPEETSDLNQNAVVTGYADSGTVVMITQSGGVQEYTGSYQEPSGYVIWTDSWTPSSAYQQLNYGSQVTSSTDVPTVALPWTLLVWTGRSSMVSAQWTRVRVFPPNNVLPSSTLGNLITYSVPGFFGFA